MDFQCYTQLHTCNIRNDIVIIFLDDLVIDFFVSQNLEMVLWNLI